MNFVFDGIKYDDNEILINLSKIKIFFGLYKLEKEIIIIIV